MDGFFFLPRLEEGMPHTMDPITHDYWIRGDDGWRKHALARRKQNRLEYEALKGSQGVERDVGFTEFPVSMKLLEGARKWNFREWACPQYRYDPERSGALPSIHQMRWEGKLEGKTDDKIEREIFAYNKALSARIFDTTGGGHR